MTAPPAASNGHAVPTSDEDGPLARLRARPVNPHGFRGFGPLLALGILFVLVVLLAPTVAPERVVLEPTGASTTTEAVTSTTDAVVAP